MFPLAPVRPYQCISASLPPHKQETLELVKSWLQFDHKYSSSKTQMLACKFDWRPLHRGVQQSHSEFTPLQATTPTLGLIIQSLVARENSQYPLPHPVKVLRLCVLTVPGFFVMWCNGLVVTSCQCQQSGLVILASLGVAAATYCYCSMQRLRN